MRQFRGNQNGMGGMRIGPGSISPVIKYLLIINSLVFLIQSFGAYSLIKIFGLSPALFFREFPNYIFQPFTYMFLHGGLFHIFFNMFALWMFGTEIEYRLTSRIFAKFYLFCGLGGAMLSLAFNPGLPNPIVGASGAIYGILVAYWLSFPDRYLLIFFMFPMRVRWAIPLFAGLNFLASGANVAHLAHLGGALVGLVYFKVDWKAYRPFNLIKSLRRTRNINKLEKNRQKAEEIMKRVDQVLDKINAVGIENISKDDKKFLEEASQILSSKKDN